MMSAVVKEPIVWQISVLTNLRKAIIVPVSENCTTAELYDELKKHPLAPVTVGAQYLLISLEGDLEYSQTKHLLDYDIVNKGTLKLVVKVTGGLWPSFDDLETRLRILKLSEKVQITTSEEHPDVFGLDDDTPRAIMACGHAVAPLSLALHCYHELEKGEESIKCPDQNCGLRWKFSQIREAACLSDEESHEFECKALFNGMRKKQEKIKSCLKCSAFCTRSNDKDKRIVCSICTAISGDRYEFCWICLREWKDIKETEICGNPDCGDNRTHYHILASCILKTLNGVECPSKRACPKCLTIMEHTEKCKHMTCVDCKYEFCFICLEPYPCKTDVWKACNVAPRQAPEDIHPITTEGKRWHILVRYNGRLSNLNVPADCFVDEFLRILRNHPVTQQVSGYRVRFRRAELENSETKRLSEYGINNHSFLALFIR